MVVHTVKSSSPDAVTLLYTPPGVSGRPGEVKLIDSERHDEHDRELRRARAARRAAGRDPRGAARRSRRSGATCRRSASVTSSSCSATTASSTASRKSSTAARRRPSARRRLAVGRVQRPDIREVAVELARRPGRSRRRTRRARRSRRSRAPGTAEDAGSWAWPGARRCACSPGPRACSRSTRYFSVRPVSTMSSTSSTRRPAIGAAQIAGDLDDAGRHRGVAVAAHAQEVAGDLPGDGPDQVGHEHERPAQDADDGQRPRGQAGVDLGPQLGDPAGDGRCGYDFAGWHRPHRARVPAACKPPARIRRDLGTWRPSGLSLTMKMPMKPRFGVVALALVSACAGKAKNDVSGRRRRPSSTSRWTRSRSRRSRARTASTWRPSTSPSCSSTRARRSPKSATTTRLPATSCC